MLFKAKLNNGNSLTLLHARFTLKLNRVQNDETKEIQSELKYS